MERGSLSLCVYEFLNMPQGKKMSEQYLYVHKGDMDLQLLKTQGKGESTAWLSSTQPEDIMERSPGENHIAIVRIWFPVEEFQKVVWEIVTPEASLDSLIPLIL